MHHETLLQPDYQTKRVKAVGTDKLSQESKRKGGEVPMQWIQFKEEERPRHKCERMVVITEYTESLSQKTFFAISFIFSQGEKRGRVFARAVVKRSTKRWRDTWTINGSGRSATQSQTQVQSNKDTNPKRKFNRGMKGINDDRRKTISR